MAQKQFHQLVMDSMTAKGIDVFSLDNIYHSMYLEEDGTTPADFTTSNMRLYQFLTEAIYVELFFDTIKFSRTKSYQIDKHDNHYNKDATIHANSKGKLEFCKMLRTPLPKDVQARKDRCQQREEEYEGRAVNVARHTYHAHQQRRAYSLYQMYHIIVNTKRQSSDGRQSLLYEMSTYTQLARVSAGKYNAPIYRTNIHPISHDVSEWCGELGRELMAKQSMQQFITANKNIQWRKEFVLENFQSPIYNDIPHAATQRFNCYHPHGHDFPIGFIHELQPTVLTCLSAQGHRRTGFYLAAKIFNPYGELQSLKGPDCKDEPQFGWVIISDSNGNLMTEHMPDDPTEDQRTLEIHSVQYAHLTYPQSIICYSWNTEISPAWPLPTETPMMRD